MKCTTTLVSIVVAALLTTSCHNKKSNNIDISQSSTFERSTHTYTIRTKVNITNRFGISLESDDWNVTTKEASEVDNLLKIQRTQANNICNQFK